MIRRYSMEIEIKKVNKKVYWHIFCTKGVKYEIVNSNGGLLGGTWDLESAKKIDRKIEKLWKRR